MSWLALLSLLACTPKVPTHLAIEPPDQAEIARQAEIQDLRSAVASLVAKDPLARAPRLPEPQVFESFEQGEALAAYVREVLALERGDGQVERALQQLEDQFPGTPVVALSRGYRLRIIENLLATTPVPDEDTERRIALLITPLHHATVDDTLPRSPMAWLDGEGSLAARVRRVGDRWVLAGWLSDPEIPLAPVGESLDSPIYDGLVQTPLGRLVQARAHGDPGTPEAIETGMAALELATRLALERAAADRDGEQGAWSDRKALEAERLGVEDPIRHLLEQAVEQLTPAAGDPTATGGALLALAALRWRNACAAPPCIGLDRVAWMHTASQWSPEVAPLAETWKAIALKEALDTMDVGHETVLFPRAAVTLADALVGTQSGPLDLSLLRRTRPAPQAWLEVSRAVGVEGATDWSEARVAIGHHLEAQTQSAIEVWSDDSVGSLLERIGARAVP